MISLMIDKSPPLAKEKGRVVEAAEAVLFGNSDE
jgi:hypothetical protein